ncbi:MAG: zinc ribbon domain-containing protein [Planctomycetes bacterium]|nr:zinc ribbon domain-containing protein [Planctomycetota bacterium]
MPIYEYRHTGKRGDSCKEVFDILQKMSDDTLTKCPTCGKPVTKLLSRFGGGVDKLAPSRLKELGFTTLRRRDKGVFEKDH